MTKFETIAIEKHEDERGYLFELLRNQHVENKPFGQIYFATINPNKVRGNHYHTRKTEWFFILKGKAKLALKDVGSNEQKELVLGEDNPLVVKIPPKVIHAVKNIGNDEAILVAYIDESLDLNDKDTIHENIME